MKITSKFLTRMTATFLFTYGALGITTEVVKHNSPKTEGVSSQTNPIEDYADPLLKSLLGLGVASWAGAVVKRRQEKVQAAKEAKQPIIDRDKERLIKSIKYNRNYGLNYTGDMKQMPTSVMEEDLRDYVNKMNDILHTDPKADFDKQLSCEINKDVHAKSLIERAKKLTELFMNCVIQNGCEDYALDYFRKLNLMSRFFQYLSDSSYNECDNITKLNIALNVFSFDNTKPSDETLKIVDTIESKAQKDLSEKLREEANKASDKILTKNEIKTMITTKLGTLCSLIEVDGLSNMMVQNAYKERDVLNRLAHTLEVTPWYELSSESFQ